MKIFRFFGIISAVSLLAETFVITFSLSAPVRSRTVLCQIEIVDGRLHLIFHHIFHGAIGHLRKFFRFMISLYGVSDILFRYGNIMRGKLLAELFCKNFASRNLLQSVRIDLIRIAGYLCAAFDQLCFYFVNNRNDLFYFHVSDLITIFHHLAEILCRHRIRHNCHIVSLHGSIDLPCFLHNVFCGLSLTFVSFVIHNCSRNV